MASNYKTSAGTDLDSVFFVDNSNAGVIGFKVSDGTDLGNRYPLGSLGYNVGYKNSAGTDLGYLRGNSAKPTILSHSITLTQYYGYKSTCRDPDHTEEDSEGYVSTYTHRLKTSGGYIKVNASVSESGPLYREISLAYMNYETQYGGHHEINIEYRANSTDNFALDTTIHPTVSVPSGTEGSWYSIYNGGVSSPVPTFTFAYAYKGVLGGGYYTDKGYIRVYQRFHTSAGYTPWVYDEVCITNTT